MKVTVGKSQTLYSSMTKRSKDKNSGLLTVGAVNIDIPQHPVALHGMMTRGSKQLSSTLQVSFEIALGLFSDRWELLEVISFFLPRNFVYLELQAESAAALLQTRLMSRLPSSLHTLPRLPRAMCTRPPRVISRKRTYCSRS